MVCFYRCIIITCSALFFCQIKCQLLMKICPFDKNIHFRTSALIVLLMLL
ncbi:hypothetical protein LP7551_01614 [Roseibium album]|nr:hypothetical protein LP7551_01614 [Roseibium album]